VTAVALYDVALAVHIMAVVAAFGLPLAYPLLVPYARRAHPRAMPAIHDIQHRYNNRITAVGTVVILLVGGYLAADADAMGEVWVIVPLVILLVIGGVGGGIVVPATRRLAELAQRDLTRADAPGDAVTFSDEYDREYRRYLNAEILLGVLVLVAIFFMTAKPFS
jgi:MFS family permease